MGYAVYEDAAARDYGVTRWAGHGVPAVCDRPGCEVAIDRGMGYRCEEYTEYRYFDERGECDEDADWIEERETQVEGCGLHFCDYHSEHYYHSHATPKPDTAEWVAHMMTDESWEEWRNTRMEKYIEAQSGPE